MAPLRPCKWVKVVAHSCFANAYSSLGEWGLYSMALGPSGKTPLPEYFKYSVKRHQGRVDTWGFGLVLKGIAQPTQVLRLHTIGLVSFPSCKVLSWSHKTQQNQKCTKKMPQWLKFPLFHLPGNSLLMLLFFPDIRHPQAISRVPASLLMKKIMLDVEKKTAWKLLQLGCVCFLKAHCTFSSYSFKITHVSIFWKLFNKHRFSLL